jgi:hypothetical protein
VWREKNWKNLWEFFERERKSENKRAGGRNIKEILDRINIFFVRIDNSSVWNLKREIQNYHLLI